MFGGYGPSVTLRIRLADGRRVFAKGAGPTSNEVNWESVALEETAYQELSCIAGLAPLYLGSVKTEEWHLLLLEDLSAATSVPPWTDEHARRAIRDLTALHVRGRSDAGAAKPLELVGLTDNWRRLRDDAAVRAQLLRLFGREQKGAAAWLCRTLDALVTAESAVARHDQPLSVIHTDVRSDNLRFRHGALVLFDWPGASWGPCILDICAFLPSVVSEAGPPAAELLAEYRDEMADAGMDVPDWAAAASAAAVAGYFAARAGVSPLEGLPRLRAVQQIQLGPALSIAASWLDLPEPPHLPPRGPEA